MHEPHILDLMDKKVGVLPRIWEMGESGEWEKDMGGVVGKWKSKYDQNALYS